MNNLAKILLCILFRYFKNNLTYFSLRLNTIYGKIYTYIYLYLGDYRGKTS